MTASELKYLYQQNDGGHFFDRETMRFFGDTMSNYGVRNVKVFDKYPDINDAEPFEALELYRRRPVKHGLTSSKYFEKNGVELNSVQLGRPYFI